ncbi:ABC transporter permease [Clostridia bacterium]|nr:ABC transporter permease [Clostridia bacterium]
MRRRFTVSDVVLYGVLVLLCGTILYPMLHVVAVSMSGPLYITRNEVTVYPRGFTLEAYTHILKNGQVLRAFLNSVRYTVVGTLINLLMTVVMAYPLSRSRLFCRNIIIKLLTVTMFFNGGIIPTFLVVRAVGLLDSMWALVLPNAIWTMELLIMISFFRSLPVSLFESAMLDGASEYRTLAQIAVPLSKASIASIAMFFFMGHWNSYLLPMIYLNTSAKFPLQLVLRSMLLEDSEATSLIMETNLLTPISVKNAVIFITMVPVMIVYPFVQRYFVKGVMIGSLKG